jgi:hypothetical protein
MTGRARTDLGERDTLAGKAAVEEHRQAIQGAPDCGR